jgi:hypothetical protein
LHHEYSPAPALAVAPSKRAFPGTAADRRFRYCGLQCQRPEVKADGLGPMS